MEKFLLHLRENTRLLDRLIFAFFLAWVLVLISLMVISDNKESNPSASMEKKINEIHSWCEDSLAPAKE